MIQVDLAHSQSIARNKSARLTNRMTGLDESAPVAKLSHGQVRNAEVIMSQVAVRYCAY